MNNFILVGFPTFDPSTMLISKLGDIDIEVNATNVYAATLASFVPAFCIQYDINGRPVLCTYQLEGATVEITDGTSTVHIAESFVAVFNTKNELVGGRPPVRR